MESQFPQKHIYNPTDAYGGFRPKYGPPISDSSGSRVLDRARFSTPGRKMDVRPAERFSERMFQHRVEKKISRRIGSQIGMVPPGFVPRRSIGRKIAEFFRSLF